MMDKASIDNIVLVGGSTSILDSKAATVQAAILTGDTSNAVSDLLDVAPLSLGIETAEV